MTADTAASAATGSLFDLLQNRLETIQIVNSVSPKDSFLFGGDAVD